MNKFFSWLFLLVFYAGTIALPGVAYAAPSLGSPIASSTTRILNDIIRRTPGVATVTTTGAGVRVGASGAVGLAGGGGLAIPVAASALVTPGRLGGMAGAAIRAGGWVGIATMVAPWIADQYGIKVCPPPDFFCIPSTEPTPPEKLSGWFDQQTNTRLAGQTFTSATAVCEAAKAAGQVRTVPSEDANYFYRAGGYDFTENMPGQKSCYIEYQQKGFPNTAWGKLTYATPWSYAAVTCGPGTHMENSMCVLDNPVLKPAEQSQIAGAVENAIANNPNRIGSLYGAVDGAGMAVFSNTDPVTVEAPPVTMPSQTSTTTQNKPDGSIDTINTTTTTKVTPNVQGGTLGNTTITYPTTTTTTTTTTNNVTNVTYTTTNVTNNVTNPANPPNVDAAPPPPMNDPAKPEPTKPTEFPKDYNKEVTQKGILDVLREFAKPVDAVAPTGDGQLSEIASKNAERVTATAGITEESTGLRGWLPDIKGIQCVNPKVPNPVTGVLTPVVICDAVDLFSQLFGGVVSVFALYGCIREVQSAIRT